MTEFRIQQIKTTTATHGFVAFFDVEYGGIVLRGLSVKRPEKNPDEAWLMLPKLAPGDRPSAIIRPAMRDAIGEKAVAMVNSARGLSLRYTAPCYRAAAPNVDAVDDMAAVRRVVRADVAEAMEMAGI